MIPKIIWRIVSMVLFLAVSLDVVAKCAPGLENIEAKVAAAKTIVIARIESASAEWNEDRPTSVAATYVTLEHIKGNRHARGQVYSRLTSVGMILSPGLVYIFLMGDDSHAGHCLGSRRLDWYSAAKAGITSDEVKDVQAFLRRIRDLASDPAT